MSENKNYVIPDNAITQLTENVYKDVAHPVLKEIGNIGESVMKLVALPFKFLGLTAEQLENKYIEFLQHTFNKIAPEERVMPKSVVAAPLLDHVKFVFEEEGLAEMFSNLLANAMSNNIEKMVHPAFVEMLKQMSPLDVEFMDLYFSKNDIVEINTINWSRGTLQKSLTTDSLSRLGIIKAVTYDYRDDVALCLTDFGKVFRNLCMLKPSEIDSNDFFSESVYIDDKDYVNSEDIGLSFEDSLGTVRFAKDSDKKYIRNCLEIEDVKKGSNIVLILRINNLEVQKAQINSVCLECGKGISLPAHNSFPTIVDGKSYYDFIFVSTQENNLLTYALNERTKYVVELETTTYDLPITVSTRKEIEIFLKYNKQGEDD